MGKIIRWLIIGILAGWLLAGCIMPSGSQLYVVTRDQYFGLYRAGAVDACMLEAREDMKRHHIPLTTMNLQQAWRACNGLAEGLLRSHGVAQPEAIPLPTTAPPVGGGSL